MKNLFKKLTLSVVIGAFASSALAAQTVNLSYNGAPDSDKNPVHAFADNLKDLVKEKTKGELEIKLYPNSMLGDEEVRMEQTMTGANLNIASFSGVSPITPEVFVSATPFMFKDFISARKFFDEGNYWKMVQAAMKKRAGVEILAVVEEGGFLAFTNNKKPIHEPKDFKGLRFRAMDPSQVALYEALGASGTPIPWTELYTALKTGVADGQMNPPAYIILGSLHEVQKHLTLANIQYSDQFLVGNAKMLESWSPELRKAFDEAVAQANANARKLNEAQIDKRIAFLKEKGMQVVVPTDAQLTDFKTIAKPAYDAWLKTQKIAPSFIDAATADVK